MTTLYRRAVIRKGAGECGEKAVVGMFIDVVTWPAIDKKPALYLSVILPSFLVCVMGMLVCVYTYVIKSTRITHFLALSMAYDQSIDRPVDR